MRVGTPERRPVPADPEQTGPSLWLPEAAVAESERLLMADKGERREEGIVYLAGHEVSGGAVVVTAIRPKARTTPGSFQTDAVSNTELVRRLMSLGLQLVGQIHSHPGELVDHSEGDDIGAVVRFQGFWSLVVPLYARNGLRPLSSCGVHLFSRGEFRRLTAAAVAARVYVVPASCDLRSRA